MALNNYVRMKTNKRKMMKQLVTILFVVGCAFSAFADNIPSEVKNLKAIRAKKIKAIDDAYVHTLKKLKIKYMKRGDLDSANAIDLELKLLSQNITDENAQAEPSRVILFPQDADLKGKDIRIHDEFGSTHYWNRDESITFELPNLSKGSHAVTLKYAAGSSVGGELTIKINGKSFRNNFESTGSWENAIDKDIGTFHHEGGMVKIKISVTESGHASLSTVNFFSLSITEI